MNPQTITASIVAASHNGMDVYRRILNLEQRLAALERRLAPRTTTARLAIAALMADGRERHYSDVAIQIGYTDGHVMTEMRAAWRRGELERVQQGVYRKVRDGR